jgi:hypothetical protein
MFLAESFPLVHRDNALPKPALSFSQSAEIRVTVSQKAFMQ